MAGCWMVRRKCYKQRPAAPLRMGQSHSSVPQAMSATSSSQGMRLRAYPTMDGVLSNVDKQRGGSCDRSFTRNTQKVTPSMWQSLGRDNRGTFHEVKTGCLCGAFPVLSTSYTLETAKEFDPGHSHPIPQNGTPELLGNGTSDSQPQSGPVWCGSLAEAPDHLWVPPQHPCHRNLQLLGDFCRFCLRKAYIHLFCSLNKSAHYVAEISSFIRLESLLDFFIPFIYVCGVHICCGKGEGEEGFSQQSDDPWEARR